MIEYEEGRFGPIRPIDEATEELADLLYQMVPVRALHVGTKEELEERKKEAELTARLSALEERVADLDPEPSILYRPTSQETTALIRERFRQELDRT